MIPSSPRERYFPAAAFLLAFLAFLPALRAGFVWDDSANLILNHAYRGLDARHLRWMFTTFYRGPYQPLAWLSLGLDSKLWGMRPWGFHLTSMLLHSLNGALFFGLSRELLRRALPDCPPEELGWGALAAALFFALHPLRAEPVALVTERRDVLAGAFALLSTLAYLRRRLRWAFGLYGRCLLSNASGAALPAAWLAVDFFPCDRLRSRSDWRAALGEKMPFFAPALLAALLAVFGQLKAGSLKGLEERGAASHLAQAVVGLGFCMQKTLWPSKLSPLYVLPADLSFFSPRVWGSAALLAAAAFALRLARVPGRAQEALWAYYAASLLPVLGLLQNGPQLADDRCSYLATLGWALLAGAAISQGARLRPRLTVLAAVSLLAVLGALSWRQARVWRDDDSLWASALKAEPASVPARINYGLALAGKRRLYEALAVYEEAQVLAPDNAALWTYHGWTLLELKRYPEAEEALRHAAALDPEAALVRTYLGAALAGQGRVEEALVELRRAAELDPNSELARGNLEAGLQALAAKKNAQKGGEK